MNEIEKRFDAAMDLVRLDHRITQKVEHQLEQRLAQEREYWRCTVSDLIAEERERVKAPLRDTHKDIFDLTREGSEELFNQVHQICRQSGNRPFDRLEAVLGLMRRPDDWRGAAVEALSDDAVVVAAKLNSEKSSYPAGWGSGNFHLPSRISGRGR